MPKASPPNIQQFLKLIQTVKPLIVRQMRESLTTCRDQVEQLAEWLTPHSPDLLSIAGLSGLEDPYTELLAWALNPPNDSALALRCQKVWLKSLGVSEAAQMTRPVTFDTQVVTDDGRPDLVLHCNELQFLVVVEAKTFSKEHLAPGGTMQTVAYPVAVRDKLGLAPDFTTYMVFLSLDGSASANEEAILTTYMDFVKTLTSEISVIDLADGYLR